MARPQVEFIQSQQLTWRAGALGGARKAWEGKVLSRDADTGATSAVVRIPPGFSVRAALGHDEEILVLSGRISVNGVVLGPYAYMHMPAGAEVALESPDGAIAVHFLDGPADAATPAAYDPARIVLLDGMAIPYTGNFHPEFPPGAGRKWLFRDPLTGEESWLLGTMPLRNAERQEVHPVVEEMFLISGEVHGDRGVMKPGAYFWRPPHIAHGPFGTRTGNLYLFRTIGGPLSTTYVDSAWKFRWDPPHAPVLPPEFAALELRGPASVDWNL